MKREVADKTILEKFAEDFVRVIEKYSKYVIDSGFECMQSAKAEIIYKDYLVNGDSVRYTRIGEFLPEMEIKFAKDSLDEHQLKTRQKLDFTGMNVYFSSIESNIAFKEEYLKSDKDLEDAKHLRIIYKDKINEEEIGKIKKEIKRLRMKSER